MKSSSQSNSTSSRNQSGIFLWICTVAVATAYAAFIYLNYMTSIQAPPLVSNETKPSEGELFFGKFQCKHENCFVTSTYSDNSKACKEAMAAAGNSFLNKCTIIKKNAVKELPICFTSDPIDGLSIIWKRNNSDAGGRAGVILKKEYFDQKSKEWKNTDIDLYFGTHLFSVNSITETISADAARSDTKQITGYEISTVQVSSESMIDDTNVCCPNFGLGYICASDGNPGTVNDHWDRTLVLGVGDYAPGTHYITKIRVQPTYTATKIDSPVFVSPLLSIDGSALTLIFIAIANQITIRRLRNAHANNDQVSPLPGPSPYPQQYPVPMQGHYYQ